MSLWLMPEYHSTSASLLTTLSATSSIAISTSGDGSYRNTLSPAAPSFFADSQTYFECGDGVRCETLTKISNNLAAFLGDPNFPRTFMSASQGEKIIRLQNLWKVYSTLGFTNNYDRAIAIEGVFTRLLAAFKARGPFGVFEEGHSDKTHQPGGLLRRMLLWYRPPNKEPMTRIQFPKGEGAPSWSWMASTGEIEFLKPKFGGIDWMEVQPPWSRSPVVAGDMALHCEVSKIVGVGPGYQGRSEGKLFYDGPDQGSRDKMECVVLGVEKGSEELGSRIHYLIIVRSVELDGMEVYERVGAGYLPRQYISRSGQGTAIC
ncbi:hypothetical protein B0H67DRAFT_607057 [Lasiosphaeris hirsuta]|uniref:Uncharacterized protein n=1 Tax=Lasiosphaeris hirsuta TaxID=260670 RepID=A0AA40AYV2_9PEZI|nr:hypothetical protein B0H67DRAFT_607057 [Lasiosphaeris hirsuta]